MVIPNTAIFITASIHNFVHLLKSDDFKEIIMSSLSNLYARKLLSVYGFVIMPNHIHIIWREHFEYNTSKETVRGAFFKFTAHQFLKHLQENNKRKLVDFWVDKSDRKYQFWNRNPYGIEIYTDKVFEQKLNYIHNNPIQQKWKLVESSMEYKYSSIRFYEDGVDEFGFLTNYFLER